MRASKIFLLPFPLVIVLVIAGWVAAGSSTGLAQNQEASPDTCRANCAAPIDLPVATQRRPTAPPSTRIAGGEVLDFKLAGRGRSAARTVLAFEQAAFIDERGNPIYSLNLGTGSNRFESRPFEDGVCHAPRGCRYVVINVGTPTRPPIINSPIVIIDP